MRRIVRSLCLNFSFEIKSFFRDTCSYSVDSARLLKLENHESFFSFFYTTEKKRYNSLGCNILHEDAPQRSRRPPVSPHISHDVHRPNYPDDVVSRPGVIVDRVADKSSRLRDPHTDATTVRKLIFIL